MRVLHVSQNDEVIGGSDVYFHFISAELKKNNVDVLKFSSGSGLNNTLTITPVDFDNPSFKDVVEYCYNSRAKTGITKILKEFKPDIVHLHIYYGQLSASILKPINEMGIPIVQTLHEYKVVCPAYIKFRNSKQCYDCKNNKLYNAFFKNCKGSYLKSFVSMLESYTSLVLGSQSLVNKFIAVSEYQKNELVKMGLDNSKLQVIHNSISFSQFDLNNLDMYERAGIVYFGRLDKVKGIDVILHALSYLKDKFSIQIPFTIIGAGEADVELRNLADSLKLQEVSFTGKLKPTEVSEYLKKAVATVVPSVWGETFGLTAIESMLHETPVIASNIGGLTETIVDGENGFLVPVGDYKGFAEHIKSLSLNPDFSNALGQKGRQIVEDRFSPDAHTKKLIDLYKDIINGCSD